MAQQLVGKAAEIDTIGDAAKPRNIASAIYEGAFIVRKI